jgi:hypothetical protein
MRRRPPRSEAVCCSNIESICPTWYREGITHSVSAEHDLNTASPIFERFRI